MVSKSQIASHAKDWNAERNAKKFKQTRLRLANLRDEGVVIRTIGMRLTDVQEVAPWVERAQEWDQRVIKAIAEIDEADARQYETLDFPGQPRAHLQRYLSDLHRHFYVCHDCRLVRLEQYMTTYGSQVVPH